MLILRLEELSPIVIYLYVNQSLAMKSLLWHKAKPLLGLWPRQSRHAAAGSATILLSLSLPTSVYNSWKYLQQ